VVPNSRLQPFEKTPGLLVEIGGEGVATVTINRPSKANTIDAVMHSRLTTLWSELATMPEVGAIILTGSGSVFCGGGDRDGWVSLIEDRKWRRTKMWEARTIIYDMLRCEVPIVCAVNGAAIGLGSSLALACDVLFMTEDSYLLDPHVPTGLVAGDGGASLLPALVPMSIARKMLFTGARLSSRDALACFLASDVVSGDQLMNAAMSNAALLASQPPQALRDTKRAVNLALLERISTSLEFSSACEESSFDTPEYQSRIGYQALPDGTGISTGDS
jgi:enoyl-CoA hydratase